MRSSFLANVNMLHYVRKKKQMLQTTHLSIGLTHIQYINWQQGAEISQALCRLGTCLHQNPTCILTFILHWHHHLLCYFSLPVCQMKMTRNPLLLVCHIKIWHYDNVRLSVVWLLCLHKQHMFCITHCAMCECSIAKRKERLWQMKDLSMCTKQKTYV